MKLKWIIGMHVLAVGVAASVPATASTFTDNLSKCLVDKSTESDKAALVQWVFSAISAGPVVQSMSTVTPAQRVEFNRNAARLMVRLLTVDCRTQAVEAMKIDGPAVIESSFGTLGQVAMRGMMADAKVVVELEQLGGFMDAPALAKLGEEAGIRSPKAK
jgi:hypothetical protein